MRNPKGIGEDIARRVKDAREAAGLSQEQMSEHLGVTRAGYGHYERGRQLFTVEQLFVLSRVLSRPVTYFLGLDDPAQPGEDARLRRIVELYALMDERHRGEVVVIAEALLRAQQIAEAKG